MKKFLATLAVLSVLVAACGDDAADSTTTTTDPDAVQLTAAEAEFCALTDASDATALRFDQIFEAGLALSLPMDALNAQASSLRTTYDEQGMTPDEAVAKVFEDLVKEPVFISACKQAYFELVTSR